MSKVKKNVEGKIAIYYKNIEFGNGRTINKVRKKEKERYREKERAKTDRETERQTRKRGEREIGKNNERERRELE